MTDEVKRELENLQLQFPGRSQINLDEYAALYQIKRIHAAQHVKRMQIPYSQEGRWLYISLTDLAEYKASKKRNRLGTLPAPLDIQAEMKGRRGFSQIARRRYV